MLENTRVSIIDLSDLIHVKKASERLRDQADAEELARQTEI